MHLFTLIIELMKGTHKTSMAEKLALFVLKQTLLIATCSLYLLAMYYVMKLLCLELKLNNWS